jgi:formylglycine-generating enzyme required for sulfatase activity
MDVRQPWIPQTSATACVMAVVLVAACCLIVSARQGTERRGPLAKTDVLQLLAGQVAQPRLRTLIETYGVSFDLTAEVEADLRAVGATDAVIDWLRAAARKRADEIAAKAREAEDAARAEKRAAEQAAWDLVRDGASAELFERFLQKYPDGQFAGAAKARLTALRPQPGAVQTDAHGLSWVVIPAGTFQMGCVPGDAECDADEEPRHAVTLSKSFALMTTEVTVGQFRASTVALPAQPAWNQEDRQPVVNVTWDEARAFCGWAGGRLPTEAEWEGAARGGREGWRYVRGENLPLVVSGRAAANVADETAKRKYRKWTIIAGCDDGYAETAPVGSFPPNAYGLYDMAGNVWEWVADWYDAGYYARSGERDPLGPSPGSRRVVRGGSWGGSAWLLRVSDRDYSGPTYRYNDGGFRCARDVT